MNKITNKMLEVNCYEIIDGVPCQEKSYHGHIFCLRHLIKFKKLCGQYKTAEELLRIYNELERKKLSLNAKGIY